MKRVSPFLSVFWVLVLFSGAWAQNDPWKKVDEGLFMAEFSPSQKPPARIAILRIDPKFYSFKLLCATELGKTRLTVKDWCLKYNLVSAINAGMYQEDGLRSVAYMKNFNHANNPRLSPAYKAVLAFNRGDAGVPEIQIIDLKCQAFEELRPRYQTFVQSIRMVSCRQENVWTRQDKTSSLAVLGMDRSGNALFIFSEPLYSGYEFINLMLTLPISLYNAMYLEGGSEAGLYFSSNGVELDRTGMNGGGFNDTLVRGAARPIPNVIGITRKVR